GQTIRIAPGVYTEQLVLTSEVEIIADGPRGSVLWRADRKPALVWRAAIGEVRGIVFHGGRRGVPAVKVEQGEPSFSDCRFEGRGQGIAISGLASPLVRG